MSRSPSFSRSPRRSSHAVAQLPHHSSSLSTGLLDVPSATPEVRRSLSTGVANQMTMRGMRRLEARRQMEETNFLSSKARSSPLNPPVDLRLLDYVVSFDDNLMCPICRCPFVDPVVLTECDHCFCRDCIRQTWTSVYSPHGPRGDCPSCRTPAKLGPRSATSKILVNILDDLLVKCPKHEEGCKSQIKRGEVQDHINIYCGYAYMECTADDCDLPVRRKDAEQGCLHYGVSCLDCHEQMQKSELEGHWQSGCPDRSVTCDLCKGRVFCRDLDMHAKETCPGISIPCPGRAFGCTAKSKRTQADIHAKSCTFARLAPILSAQQQRLDEQEAAQKMMSRKLEVLENGFSAMQAILYPRPDDPDNASADESRIPLLEGLESPVDLSMPTEAEAMGFQFPLPASSRPSSRTPEAFQTFDSSSRQHLEAPTSPRTRNLSESFPTNNFDTSSAFPPPSTNGGPYASPLHHLLSMHESLREELSRVSTGLSELDGRHSMQVLNESLRTREEISYLGAQLAGLSRQVHWLTSSQLQRQQQQQQQSLTPGGSAVASSSGDIAGAGAGVEAAVSAVNTAATALRGAARMVNVGQGQGMRRGVSEEGRTKL